MPDSTPVWVTISTAGIALGGVMFTAVVSLWNQKHQRRTDEELERLKAKLNAERDERTDRRDGAKIVAKFKDPLMHAAYDLQSRIFNILKRDFLHGYYSNGSSREQEYAVENTVFLLAQFLGWTEIVRQEIQFLALDDDDQSKKLRRLQDGIYTQLQTDRVVAGFRLFAGEQRAVGELMIHRGTSTPKALGYAAFLTSRNVTIDRWLDPLRDDIRRMALSVEPFKPRLIPLQHSLIDLLQFLDPNYVHFPRERRDKV